MLNYILFFIVILLANIMHGITGFAGTVLAMPFGLMLVGYPVAKPILNVLAIISGVYVFAGNRKYVDWKELKKIVLVMAVGMVCGFFISGLFAGKEQILYKLLGIFVVLLAVQGLWKEFRPQTSTDPTQAQNPEQTAKPENKWDILLLPAAGIVHGIFVSGGPLLIGYLTKRVHDKNVFRATISTVWIFLNTIILIDDIRNGLWTVSLLKTQLISIPFLLAGMYIGGRLVKKMSQPLFMKLTYILLFISGASLLVK